MNTFTDTLITWTPALTLTVVLLALWSLIWKGLALWHAGRRADAKWFIPLLVINTVGILEIIYLFGVCKIKFSNLFSK